MDDIFSKFNGLIVPPTTPYLSDGALDEASYRRHLDWLAEAGVQALLVAGTTAEFFSLNSDEKKTLLRLACRHFKGVVMFQAGAEGLPATLEQIRWAQDAGAQAIVCLPPYYYAEAPVRGLIEYLNIAAGASSVPFLLYNFPRHTGNPLTREVLRQVRHDGMKDSSGDLSLASSTPHYFLGSNQKFLEGYSARVTGYVSSAAGVQPQLYVEMVQALRKNDLLRAALLQDQINDFVAQLTGKIEITALKQLLGASLPGYPVTVRPPL